MSKKPEKVSKQPLFDRVVSILEDARSNVVRTVNSEMVIAYWLIGKEIVEEEQKGDQKAEYGKNLIQNLSIELTKQFGRGFSKTNIRYFRQFYLAYKNRVPEIHHIQCGELTEGFSSSLGWSHYRLLMKINRDSVRSFYEIEAVKNHWNGPQLERQISSLLFERLRKSTDKKGLMQLANKGQIINKPVDILKDPYVLEFLDLPESHKLTETKIESALLSHLQDFLLELGKGFAYVGRQKRLTLEGDHFYPDLVFYHMKLKCFVIIDLKTGKLTHEDLGQMLMYVNYYDREVKVEDDNPSIGLILCTDKNDAIVKYVVDENKQQIFASRYKLDLPTEEELIKEIEHERKLIESKTVPLSE